MSQESKAKEQKSKEKSKPGKGSEDVRVRACKDKNKDYSSAGVVVSVNTSERKTVRKKPVGDCKLLKEYGLEKDAHAGDWHRQVSLLAIESIEKMRKAGLDVGPGDFAENITTKGIELVKLPVGTQMVIGDKVFLEVTQIGKVCHAKCAIYYQAGDCVMPKEGIFAKVVEGGEVRIGDTIEVLNSNR